MRAKAFRIIALACAVQTAALPCGAQLLYYDADNSRVAAANSFSTAGNLVAAGDLKGTNVYTSGWFRNYDAQQGMYAQAYGGGYFYPTNNTTWTLTGSGNAPRLLFRDSYEGTVRGYLYSDGNFGLQGSGGNWMFYVPSGSTRVAFPSGTGVKFGAAANYLIKQTPSSYGSLSFASEPSGWHGMAFGTDPLIMYSGGSGGQYKAGVDWENYWDNGAGTWHIYGSFYVNSGYALYSNSRRVLTKAVVTEIASGQGGACSAPTCPGGSSDIGSYTSGYICWRNCLFGNNSGWGSTP